MKYQYAYFFGCLILAAVWSAIFLLRKDLRKEMVYVGLLTIPFAFSEFLFVPEYWNPPVLFDLINKIGFGIEDVLFAFFAGGLASAVYEFFTLKKLKKSWWDRKTHLYPYLLVLVLFIILEIINSTWTIYNLSFSLLVSAFYIGYKRKDLINQIVFGGLFFALLYFCLFLVFNSFYKEFVSQYYNYNTLLGIYIFTVPIEEIIFSFCLGTCWSVMYKYVKGYNTKP